MQGSDEGVLAEGTAGQGRCRWFLLLFTRTEATEYFTKHFLRIRTRREHIS